MITAQPSLELDVPQENLTIPARIQNVGNSGQDIVAIENRFSANSSFLSSIPRSTHITAFVGNSTTSAFQILNHDYLAQISKPNAIVRPLRRSQPLLLDEDEDQLTTIKIESQILPINDHNQRSIVGKTFNDEKFNFTRELDIKLRRLQKDSLSSKNGSNQDTLNKRPLFITTVPKGIFLDPPKELPVLSKRIYAFSSRPRIFANRSITAYSKDKYQLNRNEKEVVVKSFTNYNTISPPNKFRETQQATEPFKNLMYDKRVVRGSNYSQSQVIAGEFDLAAKEAEARRRQLVRKRVTKTQRGIIGTPPPVYGRKHENIQTEKYLEELFDKPPECEASAQTDLFLQKPPSPPYIPSKSGIDAATEILEGELFDFDSEVIPLVETLVAHSVEQGLIEIIHEEEIAEMKKQQQEYLSQRKTDFAELCRLEAEENRLQSEKQRRIRQDEISKELDTVMKERVTAAKLLQGHVADLIPEVLKQLEPLNEAENREELERKICPWLSKEVAEEVGHMIDSREILTEIIKTILKERSEESMGYRYDIPTEEEESESEKTEQMTEEDEQSLSKEDKN